MDEKINKPLRVAAIAGISTFVGFSIIFPLMIIVNGISNWRDFGSLLGIFTILFGYFLLAGTAVIGLIEGLLLGVVIYFISKFLIPDNITKKQLKAITISISIICITIGLLSFSPADRFVRESTSGKEHVGTIDTNRDGKPDKWVHDNIYGQTTEIDYDTNFDGKPDVWEYYKNGKV